MRRVQVSLNRLKWQRSYNRVLTSVLLIAMTGVVGWRIVDPPRERIVVERSAGIARDTAAETFAQRFAIEWMTISQDRAFDRKELGEFLGPDDSDLSNVPLTAKEGFRQRVIGSLIVQSFQLDGLVRRVVVSVTTNRGETVFVAVTVGRHSDGSLGLMGQPAIVGAPLQGNPIRVPDGGPVDDAALEAVVSRATRNYIEGRMDDLSADLDPSAVVSLPSISMALAGKPSLRWSSGKRTVYVVVDVTDHYGSRMQLQYEFGVRQLERWVVTEIHTRPDVVA